jgi:hypothetical protein
MYTRSKLTNKTYFNNIEVPQDDTTELFQDYLDYISNGGIVTEVESTPEEIATTKQNELLNELVDTCVFLTERSLISSVNKEGGEKFLQGQIERYKEKYKVAKQYIADQTINNQFWYDAIVIEMNNTNLIFNYGLDIPTFMAIIVYQFELGELRSQKFETAIEIFRCKTKDLILANEFTRAEACLEYGKNIPDQMTIEDLETFLTEFNGL